MQSSVKLITTVGLAIVLLSCGACGSRPKTTKKPNFLVIVTDDQGYGDLGRHGHPILKTPNLDRLYDESVRFTNFHVSPTCSPTRAALMTGKHEFKSGVTHTILGRERLNLKATTLAERLKSVGYATAMFGKWHLGAEGEYRPERRGFDVALTVEGGSSQPGKSHWNPSLMLNGEERQYEGYRTDIFFREATKWIEDHASQPFFCYIPTYSAHSPYIAPPEYLKRYEDKVNDEKVANFFGMIANIDDNVGRLLGKLSEWGIAENTIIVFMNDNGGTAGVDTFNAGMRGCKCTAWYGGTRAMSLWRWPGKFQPGDVGRLTGHVDVMPTLVELAGGPTPSDSDLDGISLVPLLRGHDAPWPDRILVEHIGRWPKGEAAKHKYAFAGVYQGDFHMVRSETCGNPKCEGECRIFQRVIDGSSQTGYSKNATVHYAVKEPGKWNLYNVTKDPGETKDLSEERREIVKELSEAYEEWWTHIQTGLTNE